MTSVTFIATLLIKVHQGKLGDYDCKSHVNHVKLQLFNISGLTLRNVDFFKSESKKGNKQRGRKYCTKTKKLFY